MLQDILHNYKPEVANMLIWNFLLTLSSAGLIHVIATQRHLAAAFSMLMQLLCVPLHLPHHHPVITDLSTSAVSQSQSSHPQPVTGL